MITENNWVQTNIEECCTKHVDFAVTLTPQNFKKKSFKLASEQTARKIYRAIKKPLFILLSGGADLEYVVRLFHRLKIPFTVIMVESGMNPFENKVAHLICEQLNITPVIIETDEDKIVDYYLNVMFKYSKGRSMYSAPTLMALEYIKGVGGFGITGDSPAPDLNIQDISIADHEFYADLFGYEYTGFFYYTIEMFYATIAEIKDAKNAPEFKSRVYGTVLRKKSKTSYTMATRKVFMYVYNQTTYSAWHSLGSAKEVLEYLNKWSK